MLDLLYSDPKTHSFAFQMMAYITRLKTLQRARQENPGAIIVTERCLQTDCEVFAKMLRASGDILDIHWKIYEQWASTLSPEFQPDLYIYVSANPETSLQRVKLRNRTSESSISLEYLKGCHERHETWLHSDPAMKSKVIVFDANTEFIASNESRVKTFVDDLIQNKL